MKSLGEYYWYVKMPWCGYVVHRSEYFSFYVKKHTHGCLFWTPAGLRRAVRGARISETRLLDKTALDIQ